MEKIFLPDVKSTIPNTYKPAVMIAITSKIERNRGILRLSIQMTSGYITKASRTEMVNGRITPDAIFKTAPAKIQQIKTSRKNIARPALKVLDASFT